MAPLITHENSLTKNTWITKSTIVLKQMITTNDQKLTKCMQSIKNKWIKCHHHQVMENHSTNHVDNKIYNDDKPNFLISGMLCKNNKMPQNLALCTNDVNKKIHHSIMAKFFTIDMLSKNKIK